MSSQFTLENLVKKLRTEVQDKWHPEGRVGNDGSAGNTLEDLLGVEENNLRIPDWGEIELKTKQEKSSSLVTLLHREPQPSAVVPKLIKALGWAHANAGAKYGLNEMSFRSTTQANMASDRGFQIVFGDGRVQFIFDPSKVATDKKDRTKQYATYGDWLKDVESRSPHYSDLFPVFWEQEFLENELIKKLDKTLFVVAKAKKIGGIRHFKYETAVLLKDFDSSKFQSIFEEKGLYIDFDARTNHNHGTKVRIDVRKIRHLFKSSVEIF